MNVELVISVFDYDPDWIKFLDNKIKVTLYRKGNLKSKHNEILLEPNVGRDVHTFFSHIFNNYDKLSDVTFFCQDFPFDHWENIIQTVNGDSSIHKSNAQLAIGEYYGYHYNTFFSNPEGEIISKYGIKKIKGGYMWAMENSVHHGNGRCLKCHSSGSPQHLENNIDVDSAWNKLFKGSSPPFYEFIPGGHFGVTKKQIHLRSKKFYGEIISMLESDYLAPWKIERLEPYIFNPAYEGIY